VPVVEVARRTRRFPADRKVIARLCAKAMADAGYETHRLSVAVVDDRAMHALNKQYHGVDDTTDVLAFPLESDIAVPGEPPLLGEVILSAETAQREAARRGYDYAREVALYAIHGTLHLLGYDDHDPADRRRMRRRERTLLEPEFGPARARGTRRR
jgi:probable rRNA maturation factor